MRREDALKGFLILVGIRLTLRPDRRSDELTLEQEHPLLPEVVEGEPPCLEEKEAARQDRGDEHHVVRRRGVPHHEGDDRSRRADRPIARRVHTCPLNIRPPHHRSVVVRDHHRTVVGLDVHRFPFAILVRLPDRPHSDLLGNPAKPLEKHSHQIGRQLLSRHDLRLRHHQDRAQGQLKRCFRIRRPLQFAL